METQDRTGNKPGDPKTESVSPTADLERWRVEEELRLKRDELELKRQELAKHLWSSPLVLALIGLIATILAGMVQSYFQNKGARDLERWRFESNLIQKATDTGDSNEAASRLKFYLDLGFINDDDHKIAAYLEKPGEIPLQPTAPATTDCPDVKDISTCPDQGCGGNYDPKLNKRKNIRSDGQVPIDETIQWMKGLRNPTQFTKENTNRDELAKLGEGKKIRVVAYALAVRKGGRESCNCGLTAPKDTDNHIALVDPALDHPTLEADEKDSVTAEFTPRVRVDRPKLTQDNLEVLIDPDWHPGETANRGKLLVRVTGLLLFDSEHFLGHPLKRHNNWEIHPVLKLEYCPEGKTCQAGTDQNWEKLDGE
jgi:hypothetical protein